MTTEFTTEPADLDALALYVMEVHAKVAAEVGSGGHGTEVDLLNALTSALFHVSLLTRAVQNVRRDNHITTYYAADTFLGSTS